MQIFERWAKRRRRPVEQVLTLILEASVFCLVLPAVIGLISSFLDRHFGVPKVHLGLVNQVLAVVLIIPGLLLAWWSVYTQYRLGQGTPAPMVPTQNLVIRGPYAYCRNPMAMGMDTAYVGLAVWFGSLSALALAVVFVALGIAYFKLVEEKELVARFGEGYLEYKRQTSFMLPRLRRRHD